MKFLSAPDIGRIFSNPPQQASLASPEQKKSVRHSRCRTPKKFNLFRRLRRRDGGQSVSDVLTDVRQFLAEDSQGADDGNGDESGDQTILDRGGAGFVLNEILDALDHGPDLLPYLPTKFPRGGERRRRLQACMRTQARAAKKCAALWVPHIRKLLGLVASPITARRRRPTCRQRTGRCSTVRCRERSGRR